MNPQYVGWGVGLVDLDNDGWRDIFQVNGHVYPELDAETGPERYRNPRLVYRNLGGGVFEDVSAMAGPGVQEKKSSRGAAFGDFDNDGDIDVLIMNMGEAPFAAAQRSAERESLAESGTARYQIEPKRDRRDWFKLRLAGWKQTRCRVEPVELHLAQRFPPAFRARSGDAAAKITVQWPSGTLETFPGATASKLVRLVEGSGQTRTSRCRSDMWLLLLLLLTSTVAAAEDASTLSSRAESLAREERFDEAEQLWKQAIAASPKFFPALFDLGYFYYTRQNFANAAPLLKRAAEESATDFNARYVLGVSLSKLGRTEDGATSLARGSPAPTRKCTIAADHVGGILEGQVFRGRGSCGFEGDGGQER